MPLARQPGGLLHGFITPDLGGPPSGGTLYNAQLLAALAQAGARTRHVPLDRQALPNAGDADVFWVDSLYLDAMPELRSALRTAPLMLMLHYLPSQVRLARALDWDELSPAERNALQIADGHLVTSRFMQRQIERFGLAPRRLICVEPGVTPARSGPAGSPAARPALTPLRACMLCNVIAGKGVLSFLEALSIAVRETDSFQLQIVGGLEHEPDYATACRALLAARPALTRRVRLLGTLPHPQALAVLGDSDVLLSASRMESYGMALAEARALGVPIVARAGGNTAAHVAALAGGVLVSDDAELAQAVLALARDPEQLRGRRSAAARAARARSWSQAAADFMDAR